MFKKIVPAIDDDVVVLFELMNLIDDYISKVFPSFSRNCFWKIAKEIFAFVSSFQVNWFMKSYGHCHRDNKGFE